MRIDKYISNNTPYSRTEVKSLVKAKRVACNQQRVTDIAYKVTANDTITIDQHTVAALNAIYIMLHKPAGYVCATEDAEHPTAIDLLTFGDASTSLPPLKNPHVPLPLRQQLQIAGRLDKDTTGLVLITNDGQWNHRITTPGQQCSKRYSVTLSTPLTTDAAKQFEEGIQLRGESKKTRPAKVIFETQQTVSVIIQEGRYHQIKRMFAALGNHVTGLHRTDIGPLTLDNQLNVGEYRYLNRAEVSHFNPTHS